MIKDKWLFDTVAGKTCMSSQQFRLIPIEKRPSKINLNQREARGAFGTALIPDSDYLFLRERKNSKAAATVLKNLSSPLI
jgi:hypothetical protein